jgi:hypothetical protein
MRIGAARMILVRFVIFVTSQKQSNARINRARRHRNNNKASRMKVTLFALRFNELLDFVHHSHSSIPLHSQLILSFNLHEAAWQFIFDYYQLLMIERAQSIQVSSALKNNFASQGL